MLPEADPGVCAHLTEAGDLLAIYMHSSCTPKAARPVGEIFSHLINYKSLLLSFSFLQNVAGIQRWAAAGLPFGKTWHRTWCKAGGTPSRPHTG